MATKLWDWFEVTDNNDLSLSVTQLNKLYTKWFIIALFGIIAPIMVSAILNVMEWSSIIMIVLVVATLVHIWLLFHPVLIVLRSVGYTKSVIGTIARTLSEKAYHVILYLILGSPIAHLLLKVFPLNGHGKEVLLALVMVPLAVIGTAWLSSGTWVVRKFWHLYIVILLGCVGYWGLTSFFPDLQGSEASARVHATHQTVRMQNNQYLTKKVEAIQKRINGMHESLSLEERVNSLSAADKKIWEDGQKSSFASRTTEASLPAIKKAGEALEENLDIAKAEVLKAWYGEEHPISVTLSAEEPWKPLGVCKLPIGSYRISVRNTIAAPITNADGQDKGVFNLATAELKPGSQFGITVDGKRIGETVAVTSSEQCLRISAAMFPETRGLFVQGHYRLGSDPSTTLVLTR